MFIIRDNTTGATYDARKKETVLLLSEEDKKLTKIEGKPGDQPWELWWAIKKERNSQLLLASEQGDIDQVRELLNAKKHGELVADVNARGLDDYTPLHHAVSELHTDVVNVLLRRGAKVELVSTSQRTPLHVACFRGNKEIIVSLVKHGSNINAQEKEGNAPAHILSELGFVDALSWLLEQKPDLGIKNQFGETASDLSANVEIRNLFAQHSKTAAASDGYSRTVVENLVLHNNRVDMVKMLMFKGQMLTSSKAPEPAQAAKKAGPAEEKKTPAMTARESRRRRIRIIEATKGMSKPPSTPVAPGTEEEKQEEHVGPEDFQPIQLLGRGSFGEVFLVRHKASGRYYAMKILSKERVVSQNLLKYVMTERNVLCYTKHPFIVGLDYAFQTAERLFLIIEFCPGYSLSSATLCRGDLGRMIQKERKFTEDKARIYTAEILLGLEDLHRRDIIFRDLKPENVVLDAEGHAMLTDFGLSKEGVKDNVSAKSFCGSIAYLAPEILRRSGHGKSIDWYLLGLLIYEMLVGIPPYYSSNKDQLFKNIQSAPLKLPYTLSAEAKSLIVGLLNRNPTKRLGSGPGDGEEIKKHPWFKTMDWDVAMNRGLKPMRPLIKPIPNTTLSSDIFADKGEDLHKIANWTIINNTT